MNKWFHPSWLIWFLLYWVRVLRKTDLLHRGAVTACHLFRWQPSVSHDGWLTCNTARRLPWRGTYPCLVFTAIGWEMFTCPIHHALLPLHLLPYLFIFLFLKCLQPPFPQRPSHIKYCNHIRSLVRVNYRLVLNGSLSLIQRGTAECLHSD